MTHGAEHSSTIAPNGYRRVADIRDLRNFDLAWIDNEQ